MKLLTQAETFTLLDASKILVGLAELAVEDGERTVGLHLADVAKSVALVVQSALKHDLIEEVE